MPRIPDWTEKSVDFGDSIRTLLENRKGDSWTFFRSIHEEYLTFGELATEVLDSRVTIINQANGRIIFQGTITELSLVRFRVISEAIKHDARYDEKYLLMKELMKEGDLPNAHDNDCSVWSNGPCDCVIGGGRRNKE